MGRRRGQKRGARWKRLRRRPRPSLPAASSLPVCFGTRPGESTCMNICADAKKGNKGGRGARAGEEGGRGTAREEKDASERERATHLDTARGHVELCGELLAEGRVGLCVILVHALEDLELCAGGALAVLDLVGGVGIKGADVDLGGVHARGDEGGDAGLGLGRVVDVVEDVVVGVERVVGVVEGGGGDGEGVVVEGVVGDGEGAEVVEGVVGVVLMERRIVGWDVVVVEGAGVGEHRDAASGAGLRRRGRGRGREAGGEGEGEAASTAERRLWRNGETEAGRGRGGRARGLSGDWASDGPGRLDDRLCRAWHRPLAPLTVATRAAPRPLEPPCQVRQSARLPSLPTHTAPAR